VIAGAAAGGAVALAAGLVGAYMYMRRRKARMALDAKRKNQMTLGSLPAGGSENAQTTFTAYDDFLSQTTYSTLKSMYDKLGPQDTATSVMPATFTTFNF
jgi:hypothetical protein